MTKRDLSIIVPTYNGSPTLPALLDSIRHCAPLCDFEILVCDDGSSEDIDTVIRRHGEALPCEVLRQSRLGRRTAAARNLGIRAATGRVLLFLDDDVCFDHRFLSAHLQTHANSLGPRLVFGLRHRVPSVPVLPYSGPINDHRARLIGAHGELLARSSTPWYYVYGCNFSISAALGSLLFDENFVGWGNEDIDFAYRCWRGGANITCNLDAPVFHIDQPTLADPYHNADVGRGSDFTSAILNTVRMLLKYPDDQDVANKLRSDLVGFSIRDGRCVRDPSTNNIEELLAWGKAAIDRPDDR